MQVLHQAGDKDIASLSAAYEGAGVPAAVVPYIESMGRAWGAADVAIARAGAGTVGEVWANRVPTVFLPYPHHADDHQRANALPLADAGGAVLLRDAIDGSANAAALAPVLAELLGDSARREQMRVKLGGLGPADGAEVVARLVLDELARSRT